MAFTFWQEIFSRILLFLREVHTESTGMSWMRVCGSIVITVILVVFLAHNIAALINGTGYQDFGVESVGVMFVILGAKVLHKKNETGGQSLEDTSLAKPTSKKSK